MRRAYPGGGVGGRRPAAPPTWGGGGRGPPSLRVLRMSDGLPCLPVRNQVAVDAILKRCSADKLAAHYAIPLWSSPDEFLFHVATKRNKVGKRGVPDRTSAARLVLKDWNSGKIPFFTRPEAPQLPEGTIGPATLVQDWAKARQH